MKDKVLIVEDELIVARDIRKTLEKNGFRVVGVARTAENAIEMVEELTPSLVLLDIFLKGDRTGIDVAWHLNEKGIPFIYISANSNQQVLEAAKTTDPYGFIVKPFRGKDLLVAIDIARYRYENKNAMAAANLAITNENPASPGSVSGIKTPGFLKQPQAGCTDIIGRSAPMLHVFDQIQQVAPFDTSVLILGESGTGKEGIASCIVQQSGRKNKPYIKINCAAIPAELLEAELFGYEKGSFTGAVDKRIGKFELAAGGTILLDEIGEIPPDMQGKILRVLQEKEIQRIGGNTVIKTDIRVLSATSRALEKEVAEGRFRLDLYYRLLVFPVTLPPLRERREDIPILTEHFIKLYAGKMGKNVRGISEDMLQNLLAYHWPGNVRQLQHIIERGVLLSTDEIIRHIPLPAGTAGGQTGTPQNAPAKTMEEMERSHIIAVLNQCNFRITGKDGAAEILDMSPSTLRSRIKKLGIKLDPE